MGTLGVGPSLWTLSVKSGQGARDQCKATGIVNTRCHYSNDHGEVGSRSSILVLQSEKRVSFCRCAPAPQNLANRRRESSWSPRPRRLRQLRKEKSSILYVSGTDNFGLEPLVEEKSSQKNTGEPQLNSVSLEDCSTLNSSESSATSVLSNFATDRETTESEETNGSIIYEETSELSEDEMVRQPRNFIDENAENWQMFAAEEGARPFLESTESSDDFLGSHDEAAKTDGEGEDMLNQTESTVSRRKAEDLLPLPDADAAQWTPAEKEKVKFLHKYEYRHVSEKGVFVVQAMRTEHMKATEELLVDSFAELMGGLLTYRPLLALTVKQYVRERYATLPHSVTLVGLYAPAEDSQVTTGETVNSWSGNWLVAGTAELSFSVTGHPYLPSPAPPTNAPYICNMAVSKDYRRRGLGRQMLKAAENLAITMGCEDMYLHCRMVDLAPLNMYREAGYQVVATDSLLSVLTLQRRRHLMRKRLSRAKLVPE